MGRKNRNKKNKKKKESDGSTGNVNGSSSSSNNSSDNNNNNDIMIPTVAATTTAIVLTTEQLDLIDNKMKLKGYPKSTDFVIGFKFFYLLQDDLAIDAFKRGADNDGCVPCMYFYVLVQWKHDNYYLLLPYAVEGAIRGHLSSMDRLIECYQKSKPINATALSSVWAKIKIELGDTDCTEENRKEIKKGFATECFVCDKKDLEDNHVTLVKCGICKYYSYCGKNCQTYHWKEGKHMNECRQVILLRKYCKPHYVKEIREAIIDGQVPKEIHTLQRLRTKLGLNRPKVDYEELLLSLANDDDNNNNYNNNNNNAMKRGTKVKVKGLVSASKHNGKFGIVTKVLIPAVEAGGSSSSSRRVGVKLSDESDTVLSIKIENLEPAPTTTTNPRHSNSNNRPNLLEYLIGRNDGTVHIGSTPNTI